jgi:hypothetical protein
MMRLGVNVTVFFCTCLILICQARLASLRELESQTGEELDALLPSVLDKAFKGEL